ncbi:hypothetical protein FHS83_003196 [Rhizomicrobium palustre]|uniref:Ice-binding protein C-terminal domain-containing protein n=1 Tax=Rhizomicrobium palustre TaxID=189966 RepID=A0A846N1Q3_9PROT|nr:PEP-CTERM sorting domain-containing protein [Rhizomicrobium palustre]NIK89878.1 hypothetical protein [Rhizomicrobium palustre]
MRQFLFAAVMSLMVIAPAKAVPMVHVTVSVIASPSSAFSFDIARSPTPSSYFPGLSFTILGQKTCEAQFDRCDYTNIDDFTYYLEPDGGLKRAAGYAGPDFGGTRYYGDVLFSGDVSAPTFLTGEFTVRDNIVSAFETITITALPDASVPEPASWILAAMGLASLMAWQMRRKAQNAAP